MITRKDQLAFYGPFHSMLRKLRDSHVAVTAQGQGVVQARSSNKNKRKQPALTEDVVANLSVKKVLLE